MHDNRHTSWPACCSQYQADVDSESDDSSTEDEAIQRAMRTLSFVNSPSVNKIISEITPTKASFMGLPAEIRLEVYKHVWRVPHLTFPAGDGDRKVDHCCCRWHYTCRCMTRGSASLLATNKQIFREAMPFLYATAEYHIDIRQPQLPNHKVMAKQLREIVYGAEYIEHVFIKGPTFKWSLGMSFRDDDPRPFTHVECCAFELTKVLPNLKHVRVHLDASARNVRRICFANLAEFALLPKLDSILIQIHAEPESSDKFRKNSHWDLDLKPKLIGDIRSKLKQLGKEDVKLDAELLETGEG